MALEIIFKNNAVSTLLAGITNVATSVSTQAGHGNARFSAPGAGQIAKVTLYNNAGAKEIVHCTGRTGDTLTIARGQEGTTALAWNAGDGIEERPTAGWGAAVSQLDRTETFTAVKTFAAGIAGATSFAEGIGPEYIQNIGIPLPTVLAGAMTILLQTKAFATPSASSPVDVAFRSRTETEGATVIRQITAATSIVIPSGAIISNDFLRVAPIDVSVASPCVVTHYDADLVENQAVYLTSSSGSLPTGLVDDTVYYVKNLSGYTFNVSATPGGVAINTSGALTGTPYAYYVDKARMYLYLCDNGTTRELGVTAKPIFSEKKLHNTTAISVTADDGYTLYTTNAMTNAAVRLIGFIDVQPSLPVNSWDVAPTRVGLMTSSQLGGMIHMSHAKQTSITGITTIPSNFGGTPNLEVGDLVTINWMPRFNVASGDYAYRALFPISGTCMLESIPGVLNPTDIEFALTGVGAFGTTAIRPTFSATRKVTKAGTFAMNSSSNANYGTAVTNQGCLLVVDIFRPNL